MTPDAIMIFAAGLGTRFGDLVKDRPKPLIRVCGKPLIDHALDIAEEARVARRVVNVHYKPDLMKDHLAKRGGIVVSDESDWLLETGGGLRKALPLLGSKSVITMNSDAVWRGENPITRLRQAWDPDRMEALLLLIPLQSAIGHMGKGDFLLDKDGRLSRSALGENGLVYSGVQIIRTDGVNEVGEEAFSLNRVWDIIHRRGGLFGIEYEGRWADVGTPQGLECTEKSM